MASYVQSGYTAPGGVNSSPDIKELQRRLGVTANPSGVRFDDSGNILSTYDAAAQYKPGELIFSMNKQDPSGGLGSMYGGGYGASAATSNASPVTPVETVQPQIDDEELLRYFKALSDF